MAFLGENALLAGAIGALKKSNSANRSELFDMGIVELDEVWMAEGGAGRATGE